MDDLPKLSELHVETERNRIDFLQTDLALCSTFADLVMTELRMGDQEAAQRVLAKAEERYATIAHLLGKIENTLHRNAIQEQLNDLRTRLDNLQLQ